MHVCRVYELEKRVKTQDKFMFPYFETLHWYAAAAFYDLLLGSIFDFYLLIYFFFRFRVIYSN